MLKPLKMTKWNTLLEKHHLDLIFKRLNESNTTVHEAIELYLHTEINLEKMLLMLVVDLAKSNEDLKSSLMDQSFKSQIVLTEEQFEIYMKNITAMSPNATN